MFVLGFDPVFLDILVSPFDQKNQKLSSLPKIGEHITTTEVSMIPGGNSLNVARVLAKITDEVYFFSSFNNFFLELVQNNIPPLHAIATRSQEPNYTVALQFKHGEIQMNSLHYFFGLQDISFNSLYYLTFSKVVPFSNIGLNKQAPEVFDFLSNYFSIFNDFQLRSPSLDSFDLIKEFFSENHPMFDKLSLFSEGFPKEFSHDLTNQSFNISQKIFYFDPSSLKSFTNWNWLNHFITNKFGPLPGFKIISLNEHEYNLMKTNLVDFQTFLEKSPRNFLIVHESTNIRYFQHSLDNMKELSVPSLNEDTIVTSVGAGDSFNAGLIYEFSKSFDIISACSYAITVAQRYMTNTL